MALGSPLGSLIVKIETDLTNLNNGLRNADKRVQQTRGSILKSTTQIGRSFTIMGAIVTAVVVGITKTAIDFEDAFAGVRKTVDATEKEFLQLATNFRYLSTQIPIAAVELAKIGEIAGQLGIRGVENLTIFTETIALIGVTTDLASTEAATAFARIATIMDEAIENVDRMGATVVELGNNFAATESEIVEFATRIAGAGKIAGLTTAEIFALGTAFTAVGIKAEAGGTSVQKVLNAMTQAAAEGGEKLTIFAEAAGLTAKEFVALRKTDPAKVFALFVKGLGEAGDQSFAILRKLGLQNERVIRSFLSMAEASDVLFDTLETANSAWEENVALQIEAEKRFATTASQLKILLNNIVETARKIGDLLLPALKPLIDGMKEMAVKIGVWIKENPKLSATIIKIVAVVGLLMLVLGPLLLILPQLVAGIQILAGATALGALWLILGQIALVAAAAFASWKIGEKIAEVTGLNEVLSGPDGLFTKMFLMIDEAVDKWNNFFDFIDRKFMELPGVSRLAEWIREVPGEEEGTGQFGEKEEERTAKVAEEVNKREKLEEDKRKKGGRERTQDFALFKSDLKSRVGELGIALSQAGVLNEGFAKAGAVIKMAEAVVNVATGITRAYAEHTWPFSMVIAGIIATAGALQIATIASQSFQEGTDSVPAMLTPGEIVIPRGFADAVRAGDIVIGGREEIPRVLNIENTFNFENVVLSNDIDIETLGEKLGETIEETIGV